MKQVYFLLIVIIIATTSFAQNTEDTTDHRFHDDLLDHLVGKWNVTSIAHGSPFTSVIDASWILNHQYLVIHLKSNEVIPWWHVQMEYYEYIGYNHYQKRYTVHGMSIEGDEDLSEGFSYGYRNGNDFKTVAKFGADANIVQHFIWHPETNSWNIQSRQEINGKEGDIFLDMKLTAEESKATKD
ncbi:hypothetical protein FC093_19975 [Ilyomonas limi]|uniref:DUF1579 domain-containing protein n=1 Tax=Ilyomonas limi TaxID=2575867 RepID=A0A4U3KSU4_9BACT|nr:hypothetical protein [Ilyomonas limi]TKK65390.1 hypothetical protein FC093_19975 [Ilyomonas limi]